MIGAALVARAAGAGHRRIAAVLGVPASTVRGWLRRMSDRLEQVRAHFTVVTRRAGVDQSAPSAAGSAWRDVVAAVGAAWVAVTSRFGPGGVLGAVTAWQVASASSGGRLLSPGWPRGDRMTMSRRLRLQAACDSCRVVKWTEWQGASRAAARVDQTQEGLVLPLVGDEFTGERRRTRVSGGMVSVSACPPGRLCSPDGRIGGVGAALIAALPDEQGVATYQRAGAR